jgi:TP901-1 family phage major tail protein
MTKVAAIVMQTMSLFGGFKSNKLDFSSDSIDITNKDSGGFKESLESAGNVSLKVDGSGVFLDDASFQRVHDHFLSQTHPECKIVVPDFAEYTGKFEIESLSLDGAETGAVSFTIGLTSSGAVTVTSI